MKKRKSVSDKTGDKTPRTGAPDADDASADSGDAGGSAPPTDAQGEDVATAGEDIATASEDVWGVGEDVTTASADVGTVGQDVSTLGEDVWSVDDDAAGSATSVAGDAAETGNDDVAFADDGAPSPDAALDAAVDDAILPNDASRFESILESLLFATDRPLSLADLKRLLGERDGKRVTSALESLRARRADCGVQLITVAGGWQLRTHPANGLWVAKLVSGRPQRLSRAMMETLAIVAYRQPITRPEIDEIRGVDCGPVLRTLLDRTLIRVIGKKEEVGRPILYGTTPEFLKTFSLRDLTELPTLREFHELGADEQARVDAASPPPEGAPSAAAGDAAPLRPSTVDLPDVDSAEEDALLEELEQATQLAGRATKAHVDPESEAPQDATGPDTGET